jgi:hypothetical protein
MKTGFRKGGIVSFIGIGDGARISIAEAIKVAQTDSSAVKVVVP